MAQKRTNIIPKAPMARILMNAGAKRVSADGVDAFTELLQETAEKIGAKAAEIAKHSGRKTVQGEDIKLAARQH